MFALNIAQPRAPEFLSSVFLDDCSSSKFTFSVVLLSSSLQAYVFLCSTAVVVVWEGHVFLFTLAVAELLHAMT